ncbi:substrate-binding domain-containing protein [Paenibacillus frigoriresistens]|uniref:sugar ABC transporter substrate-binding protein n=1 Tax=Paenibacillus alginolyticus TaxID=59839 RepID=UPI001564D1C6|nr:substrate-binding domain-containing protein [Paenibacillus frigoriresistens]NRF92352.1 substrate-binding domain-containing protein [Paenibacillus frigoriresistens]
MSKIFVFIVSTCLLITILFTFHYVYLVYQSSRAEQINAFSGTSDKIRIVMITQELESPFSKALQNGIDRIAKENSMEVNVWGTYHSNLIELLKYMDIAIASKVDGIIVQAMDGPEFVDKVQTATEKGIPVITVGTDAPRSLRKTYVGPDHSKEGELIAAELMLHMQEGGLICLVSGSKMTSTERIRLENVQKTLSLHPSVKVIIEEGDETELNQSKQLVNEVLNRYPEMKMFVGLNAEAGIGIVQALRERGRGDKENVYAFDDTPELREMVDSGWIKATLVNDNTTIGEKSILLIKRWLENADLPLPRNVNTQVILYKVKGSQ